MNPQVQSVIQKLLSPDNVKSALAAIGALSLFGKVVPRLLAWGLPASVRAADWCFQMAMKVPGMPWLMRTFGPAIIQFMDDLVAAFVQLVNSFKDELEKDIEEQEQKTGGETPPAGGQGNGPKAAASPDAGTSPAAAPPSGK